MSDETADQKDISRRQFLKTAAQTAAVGASVAIAATTVGSILSACAPPPEELGETQPKSELEQCLARMDKVVEQLGSLEHIERDYPTASYTDDLSHIFGFIPRFDRHILALTIEKLKTLGVDPAQATELTLQTAYVDIAEDVFMNKLQVRSPDIIALYSPIEILKRWKSDTKERLVESDFFSAGLTDLEEFKKSYPIPGATTESRINTHKLADTTVDGNITIYTHALEELELLNSSNSGLTELEKVEKIKAIKKIIFAHELAHALDISMNPHLIKYLDKADLAEACSLRLSATNIRELMEESIAIHNGTKPDVLTNTERLIVTNTVPETLDGLKAGGFAYSTYWLRQDTEFIVRDAYIGFYGNSYSFSDLMSLKWVDDFAKQELLPEDRNKLDVLAQVIRLHGAEFMVEYNSKATHDESGAFTLRNSPFRPDKMELMDIAQLMADRFILYTFCEQPNALADITTIRKIKQSVNAHMEAEYMGELLGALLFCEIDDPSKYMDILTAASSDPHMVYLKNLVKRIDDKTLSLILINAKQVAEELVQYASAEHSKQLPT